LDPGKVIRLYPAPQAELTLPGLYLRPESTVVGTERTLVYSNFISSLDGRVAVKDTNGDFSLPEACANDRDWRLFQELCAQSDMLLVSASYLRKDSNRTKRSILFDEDTRFADLHDWRQRHDLPAYPAVTVLAPTLNPALPLLNTDWKNDLYIATACRPDTSEIKVLESHGIRVLIAGSDNVISCTALIHCLSELGFRRIYSAAGPRFLATLVRDGALDRLYLTQVNRLIGGAPYYTLIEGADLKPPRDFGLRALYYDPAGGGAGQLFSVYDYAGSPPAADTASP
jgi:riboflavin biosynthesis pyrimidine reductase